jgi:hypothetical protein
VQFWGQQLPKRTEQEQQKTIKYLPEVILLLTEHLYSDPAFTLLNAGPLSLKPVLLFE